jgi:guanosine-3',5'-bis(diphosphate) 3'-pyrophosphohydrolase
MATPQDQKTPLQESDRPESPAAEIGAGAPGGSPAAPADIRSLPLAQQLNELERRLLGDLFAIVSEHAADTAIQIDRTRVEEAFVFACEHHAAQRRKSGEEFIVHPVGVARICAGMRLDTETLCAALLHDTVEDTSASIEEVRERFGEEIANVVDGVTKLTGITFHSRDEAQAENYRKMMVAMATDVRVILIKLADRLHNMRTIEAMPKQKQIEKAKETLEIYAPIAHRLGIHAIKWELEDLAFATLHPRKYQEIKGLVAQQRDDREHYVSEAGEYLTGELHKLGVEAQIAGRAKHFYSIYSKMTKKGKEFNEIYDLTAMRVIVDSVKDCYGAVGVIHSLWKPLPGRFKDFIAMPKFNMYQSLHTTVIGPEGRPLEIQIRTHEMHEMAEFGVAAHWMYKRTGPTHPPAGAGGARSGPNSGAHAASPASPAAGAGGHEAVSSWPEDAKLKWLRSMLDWQQDASDPQEFMESLKIDLFEDEVYVFTPKGEVKSLAAGATPLDFAYEVHTEIGHRCVGARINGKIVPLHYELRSGDIVEILTAKRERGPSRDWLAMVKTTRARNKIKAWFKAESRQDTEHTGREVLQEHLKKQGLPAQRITGSALLADVIREMGYRKADDFYIALGAAKVSPKIVVNKVMQRLKQGEAADGGATAASDLLRVGRSVRRPTRSSGQYGIRVEGVEDVMLRLAKCCRPVPGDPIVGYISLGRGITIHREDCPNATVLRKNPERFTHVYWEGEQAAAFVVEIQIDAWDRHRLLEDLSRVFSEAGANIVEARCLSNPPMVKNRFVVEVADTHSLKGAINRLRNTESVFDAYRVTPGGA